MKAVLRLAYWPVAVAILAAILMSLDYTLAQAVFLALTFCPCALALEFWMPKARRPMDKVYLALAVLVSVVLLIIILHYCFWTLVNPSTSLLDSTQISPMLINPAFLGLILTALSIGDYYWSKYLSRRYKTKGRTITFFSERKSVTLPLADIAYVESNDTEVYVVTVSGDKFRNKTGIGQWENLLGEDFLRIHRSYLVNIGHISQTSADTVTVCETPLPVSRKYKEAVLDAVN